MLGQYFFAPILDFFKCILPIACLCCISFTHLNANPLSDDDNLAMEFSSPSENPVTIHFFPEEDSIQPGRPLWLAVQLEFEKGWHGYWKNPGASGMPIQIDWTLPEGFTVEEIQWPYPHRFDQSGLIGYGYEDNAILLVRLKPPSTQPSSLTKATIQGEMRWLVCSDAFCVPGDMTISLELPVSTAVPNIKQEHFKSFEQARANLPTREWDLTASESDHLIEIQMKSSKPLPKHVQFFPENRNCIDDKAEVVLTPLQNQSGRYSLILKEHDKAETKILKGVIVLSSNQPHIAPLAIDVDIPVKRKQTNELVSIADPIKKSTATSRDNDDANSVAATNDFEGSFGLALIFAFFGGLILNLMPCVFPVISFKILSFVNMSGKSRSTTFAHGAIFSLGVLVSFWVFAGILILLKSYGHEAGWGFQLQQPLFVGFLSALLLVFALSLFGVFEFGTIVTAAAGDVQQKVEHSNSALIGSFFSGILATALATPCAGPFMAPALGFAATLPTIGALSILTALGIGMAAPYLILSAFPSLLRFLPKPGAWMTTFKEIMGFLMLATVLWLISVFGAQAGMLGTLLLLTGFFVLALACWIYGRCCLPSATKKMRTFGMLMTALFAFTAVYIVSAAGSPLMADVDASSDTNKHSTWENFSSARLEELRQNGTPVFIDFTAKWCLVCQVNHLVLSTEEVFQKFDDLNVVKMKADWTRNDPEITKLLRKFGRNSVPLYILYGKDANEPAQVLPQILTPAIVINALNKIKHETTAHNLQ